MEDFRKNRTEPQRERDSGAKTASEERAEIAQQERSVQHEEGSSNNQNYTYDEYDSYSPWG